jgi:uncharacterized protein YkwD
MLSALALGAALVSLTAARSDTAAAQTVAYDINQRRAGVHADPLTVDPQLTAIATERAADLVRRHYFAHVSPDGTTAIDALRSRDVSFAYAGENLANAETVLAAEAGLWASPDHRENIVERHYRRIGIAVLRTPDDGLYVVQIFAD